MSTRTEIPVSTLSKVERGALTLNYPQLVRLMERLHLRAADLFGPTAASASVAGWRSIQRGDAMSFQPMGQHEYAYACAELRQKKMKPVLVHLYAAEIRQRDVRECEHGDIYLFVLEGSIQVSTRLYEPVVLNAGDSIYMNAGIEPTYAAAAPDGKAVALIVFSTGRSLSSTAT